MQGTTAQMALLQFMTAGLDAGRGADDRALRPPHPGQGGAADIDLKIALDDERRGLRLPRVRVGAVRHRLLEAGLGDHPPGRARELRLPRRDDDRHRQPHAQRRRPRHGRDRRRRRGRGRRHDRLPVQRALAEAHRRAPHRRALRLVVAEGRDPEGRRGAHRRRAAPARSSSTSVPAPTRSPRPARARSATWAPRSARPRRSSPYDANMAAYLKATGRADDRRRRERRRRATCGADPEVEADPSASSTGSIEIDLDHARAADQRTPHARPRAQGERDRRARARPTTGRWRSRRRWSARARTPRTRTSRVRLRSRGRRRRRASPRRHSCSSPRGPSRCARRSSATACSADLEAHRRHRARQRVRPVHRPVGPHRHRSERREHDRQLATTATSRSATTAAQTRFAFVTSPDTVIALRARRHARLQPAAPTRSRTTKASQVKLDPPVGEVLPAEGLRPWRERLPRAARRRRRRRSRRRRQTRPPAAAASRSPPWDGKDLDRPARPDEGQGQVHDRPHLGRRARG